MKSTRRSFIQKTVGTALAAAAVPAILTGKDKDQTVLLQPQQVQKRNFAANDQVNIGVIGMGIMGFSNLETSMSIPGVKLVGACDLYSGRLDRTKEKYGKDIFTTKNYQELLDRKDIDAVIIATSDHWHDRISIDALNKGKHIYCEKPMVHKLEEGADVVAAQARTGKVYQVGSQRVSALATWKAKELFESGIIGDLILVETFNDRHSANGAWQYSIPTDAKNNTVDWDRFLGDAPKMPYDPVRFFRWRNYQDYGTGMAGDLFVHLFSGLHAVISSNGPSRVYATGGLRYWKDGRDVPDIMTALYDYPATAKHPAFNLQMRVNFVDGSHDGESLRLIGSEGAIILGWDSVKVVRNKVGKAPGYGGWDSFDTFTSAQQKEYEKWYSAHYPAERPMMIDPGTEYKTPKGYSANIDHHTNFYNGIREGKPIVEDAWFGLRAAGAALLANRSYFEKKVVNWDPDQAKLI
ncbi:MAG: Gfo/Idh/MocA family oxidoreductase [Cyclobacteriaceae bacterium]